MSETIPSGDIPFSAFRDNPFHGYAVSTEILVGRRTLAFAAVVFTTTFTLGKF